MSSGSSDSPGGYLKSFTRTLLLLLILPTGLAYGLPSDKDQAIHLTADKALRNEKKGVTMYSGNVHMRQGSMELEADTLVIYHVTEDADKIIATGNPAKMRQQPELDQGMVYAEAKVITYFKNKERVHLQTAARVEREGDLVTGDSIDYFITSQVIKAESDKALEGEQVVVVIKPSARKETNNTPALDPNTPADATGTNLPHREQTPETGTPPTPATSTPKKLEQQEDPASGTTDSE